MGLSLFIVASHSLTHSLRAIRGAHQQALLRCLCLGAAECHRGPGRQSAQVPQAEAHEGTGLG